MRPVRGGRSLTGVAAVTFALTVVLAVLSGCASIPNTGPVLSGRVVDVDPRFGMVQLGGFGPEDGDSPVDVVTGFIRAAAGFTDDHKVARSFLTSDRQLTWRPDAKVAVIPRPGSLTVKESGVEPTTPAPTAPAAADPGVTADPGAASADVRDRAETTRVTVKTPVTATIDNNGRYEPAAPGATVTSKFVLVKRGGNWRISALENGILISESDLEVTFRPFTVYFGDPTGQYLVPDLHWLPAALGNASLPELPTALVRALLAGPSGWLADSVITGAPAYTNMAVAAVVVADDVATVDLTDQVRNATTKQRQLLIQQLQATLGQLRIGSVEITVRRLAFDVPSGPSRDGTDPSQSGGQLVTDPQVDARPVAIDAKGRVARLEGGTLAPIAGLGGLAVAGVNRPAVSVDSSSYAALNADRSKLLLQRPGAKALTLVTSTDLVAPSFDPLGWVWTAPEANTGLVYAAGVDADPIKVKVPWLKGAETVSLRMSRDGTRAAIAARVRGRDRLFFTGVVRDVDGRPVSLADPAPDAFPDLKEVRGVAWTGENEVVVLGRRTGSDATLWRVQIGGGATAIATPLIGAESIAAGNGEGSVLAGTSSKALLGRTGALWGKVAAGRWPAFAG